MSNLLVRSPIDDLLGRSWDEVALHAGIAPLLTQPIAPAEAGVISHQDTPFGVCAADHPP
jgi:hypothetical protein